MNYKKSKYRLAVLTSHPIQYQAPLFRKLALHPEIEIMVYFCWNFGVGEEQYDPGFGKKIKWDIPLLEGYRYKFLPNISPKPSSSFFGQTNPAIIKELLKHHYDAIWIHGYTTFSNLLALLGAWLSRTPVLLRGESHLLNYRALWKRFIKRISLPLLFKGISAFLPIGSLNKGYYRYYGVNDRKMFLTPYAVDNDYFHERFEELFIKREQLKIEEVLVPSLPIILYASKMIPRKRAVDLVKAFHLVSNRVDAQLVMIGDGLERPSLEEYIKDNNIKNVYFLGFKNQTELPKFYAISDIFVLPSTDEPWGLVINEAMNFGLPIITTDRVGAAYDLVKDGENGFIYPVGDIEKLADLLLKVLKDTELRKKMGRRSLELIAIN